MTQVLLFHHAQGLTDGVVAFADELRRSGHAVSTPDLYEGATFATVDEGVAHAKAVGFEEILGRGVAAAQGLTESVVYGGFSLGVMPAQKLAQTRTGALGALLYHAAFAPSHFGDRWPAVPVQVHAMDADPEFANEWDLPAAREIVAEADDGELFLYPGSAHLFADSSLADYQPDSADLLLQRTLRFLEQFD